jgi:hypothetical protein
MPSFSSYSTQPDYLSKKLGGGQSQLALSAAQQMGLTRQLFNSQVQDREQQNMGWTPWILRTGAAATLDFVDVLNSSSPWGIASRGIESAIGINIPLNARGDMWDLTEEYGMEAGRDLAQFYRANSTMVEAVGGIGGAIATAGIASSLVLPKITNALASSSMISGSKLWQAGARVNASVRSRLATAQAEAAQNGQAFKYLSGPGLQYIGLRATQGVGVAAFEEAAIIAAMNQNSLIVGDDMANNLFWASIGITAGGALGGVASRFEMRRMLNDQNIVAQRAVAMDPQNVLRMWEENPSSFNTGQKAGSGGKESAVYTALRVASRQETPTSASPELGGRLDAFRNQNLAESQMVLQKLTTRGIEGNKNTGFSVNITDKKYNYGQHLMEASQENPTLLLGADSIGTFNRVDLNDIKPDVILPADTGNVLLDAARATFKQSGQPNAQAISVQKFKASHTPQEVRTYRKELLRLQKQSGEWAKRMTAAKDSGSPLRVTMEARKIHIESLYAAGDPALAKRARELEIQQPLMLVNKGWLPADTADAFEFAQYKRGSVKVSQPTTGVHDYALGLTSGSKRRVNESLDAGKIHNLSTSTWLETVEGMGEVMKKMMRAKQALVVPKTASWSQLDAFREYEKRGGVVDWKTQAGMQGAEDAELASIQAKAKIVGTLGNTGAGGYWNRLKLNLPLPSSLERIYDPAGDTMRAVLEAATKGATLAELKQLRVNMMNQHGFRLKESVPNLDGDMFNFNLSEQTKEWMDTPVAFFDTAPTNPVFHQGVIAEQIAELKAHRFIALTENALPGQMLPTFTKQIVSSPNFVESSNIRGLADDQVTGLGNWGTQLAGELLTREHRYRDSKVMLSALKIAEEKTRGTDAYLQTLVKNEMADVIPRLNAAPAAGSKVLLNQFLSNTSGWDLRASPVMTGGGKWAFELAETLANETRLGRKVVPGEILKNPRTGNEIVLDDLGLEFMTRFNSASEYIRADRNRVRTALGLDQIARREWYTPPAYTKNKYVAFTFDADNNPIPGGAIIGETQAHFNQLMSEKRATLPKGHKIWTREEVESTADIYGMAAVDWIDPGTGVAPARAQTGTLAMDTVNQYAVQDTMDWMKRSVESNANGAVRVLYDAQLGIARARGAAERMGGAGKKAKESVRSIWDEYEATILGRKLGDTGRSITGNVMKPIESFLDRGLEEVWPAMSAVGPTQWARWYSNVLERVGAPTHKARTFSQLAQNLGPYTPYKDAVDYAEQTLKIQRPAEVKKISEKLNWLAASTLLRYMEIPHAAMNLIGIMTTMPSIAQSGRAPITGFMQAGKQRFGVVDTYKILGESVKDMTRMSRHPDWKHMVDMGYTEQQVAEYNLTMSAIKDRGSFNRVFFGDPNRTGNTLGDKVAQKGIDGVISLLTDTTESWSRTYSHFVGLRLADAHGITGLAQRHEFAHEVANAAIANYNPLNRPELYNSAMGSMFGLFMSWTQNYNQRLFRWLEQGDYQSVGRQLGVQSALFGVASMPGYNHLESLLMSTGNLETEDGNDATMMDMIYAKFGPQIGSMIAHGGINQFNTVLYTRGDMNYRNASLDPTQLMAGVSVIGSGVKAAWEAGQAMTSTYGLEDANRLGEIFARNMPNRMLKGTMEAILNGGQSIDANGRIISENRTAFESSLRILGLRSSRQQAEIEAFYADKQQQAREAARSESLREDTRNLMRKGPGWEKSLPEIFEKYMKLGFRPEHFRTWVQNQLRDSTDTRGIRDLQRAMQNPQMQQSVWRYNAYGAL